MNMKVAKTIKNFVGGKFPRTESGRSFAVYFSDKKEEIYANLCLSSRKDFREAVEVAHANDWAGRTAFNKSQILYRMAEMMEGKREEFGLVFKNTLGWDETRSNKEVDDGIDAFFYYAGFCDKFSAIASTVNPINGPFGNTTSPEPVGVVTLIPQSKFSLGKLVADISAAITGGNSVIVILDSKGECPAVIAPLSEVFATSDLPGGAVNIMTGDLTELMDIMASHMDVRSFVFQNENRELYSKVRALSVENLKRVIGPRKNSHSLDAILDTVEYKTIWQSVGY